MAATKSKTNLKEQRRAKRSASPGISTAAATHGDSLFASLERLGAGRVILLICLLSFLAYANSLGGEFLFDDQEMIVENQDLRSWDNLARVFKTHAWAFRERPDNLNVPAPLPYYRPVLWVLLTIEYHLFGTWPQGWHIVNLLMHILCSIGVYYVLLLMSGRNRVAMIAALSFAVYPVHAESVSWISGITDPLYSAFYLASFYLYLKYCDRKRKSPVSSRIDVEQASHRKSLLLIVSLLMFAVAAFSKETALSLVLLVFGYEIIDSSLTGFARLRRALAQALPYFAVAMAYMIPRFLVLGEAMFRNPQAPERPLAYTLLTLPFVICSYIFHLAWPVGLSVTYDTHFVTDVATLAFIGPAAILLFTVGLIIKFRKRISRDVWLALLLLFVPLLPVLNLGQVSQEEYLVFDHYLYLSVAGWTYLMAIGLSKLGNFDLKRISQAQRQNPGSSGRPVEIAVAAVVLLLVALTVANARENRPWADLHSLWSNAAQVRPRYYAPRYNQGVVLLDSHRYDEARAALEAAARLKPDEPMIFDALGRAYDALGDSESALRSLQLALELNPEMFESLNNIATVYYKAGDYTRAEHYFVDALRVKPQAVAARFNLGLCYSRQNRLSEAAREFERVIEAAPTDAEAQYELGTAYERMGRAAEAAAAFKRGLASARSQTLAERIAVSLNGLNQ